MSLLGIFLLDRSLINWVFNFFMKDLQSTSRRIFLTAKSVVHSSIESLDEYGEGNDVALSWLWFLRLVLMIVCLWPLTGRPCSAYVMSFILHFPCKSSRTTSQQLRYLIKWWFLGLIGGYFRLTWCQVLCRICDLLYLSCAGSWQYLRSVLSGFLLWHI